MRVLRPDQKVIKIRVHYIRETTKDYQLSEEEYEHFKKIRGNKNKEEYLVDADKITDRLHGGAETSYPYHVRFEANHG